MVLRTNGEAPNSTADPIPNSEQGGDSESTAGEPMSDRGADATLDVTGLLCPLPVLEAKRALHSMPPDSVLEVLASDPLTRSDLMQLCNANGYELLETAERPGGRLRLLLKKPAAGAPG